MTTEPKVTQDVFTESERHMMLLDFDEIESGFPESWYSDDIGQVSATIQELHNFARRVEVAALQRSRTQAKSVPDGWTLVPKIGTKVKANHPITCLNPEEYFAVDEIQAFGGNITVRGENTCWFGMNIIAAPQPSQSIEADRVRELEALIDDLLDADMTANLNGGGAHARHVQPAIMEIRKFRARNRKTIEAMKGE